MIQPTKQQNPNWILTTAKFLFGTIQGVPFQRGEDQMLASCNLNLMYSKVIFGNTIHLEPIK